MEPVQRHTRSPLTPLASAVERTSDLDATTAMQSAEPVRNEPELSALAKQLSAAAERAAARDAAMSRQELADFALGVLDKLMGPTYSLGRDVFDNQVPDTDDPELLERARQANAFATGQGENPFKGLSREQLSLIIYDESGDFTVNERRAARIERTAQHNEWARSMMDKMGAEYRQTGRTDNGLREVIDFYDSLPRIEVAQYGNYETALILQGNMPEADWPEVSTALFDLLVNHWEQPDDTPDAQGAAPETEGPG